MARQKCLVVKGLRVEIFLLFPQEQQKNTTRPLTTRQGGAVEEGEILLNALKGPYFSFYGVLVFGEV